MHVTDNSLFHMVLIIVAVDIVSACLFGSLLIFSQSSGMMDFVEFMLITIAVASVIGIIACFIYAEILIHRARISK